MKNPKIPFQKPSKMTKISKNSKFCQKIKNLKSELLSGSTLCQGLLKSFSKMIIPQVHPFQLTEKIILKEIETFMMDHPTQKSYQEVPKSLFRSLMQLEIKKNLKVLVVYSLRPKVPMK